MQNWKRIMATVAALGALTLAGCGGGGSAAPATATGKFVDAPVAGMTYESGSQKGVTGADGTFTYEVGKMVKFSIGDIVLGEAEPQAIMTPVNLAAAGADSTSIEVVARVQLLMSLSSTDPNSGIITIPAAVSNAAKGKSINFTSPTVQTDLATLVSTLGVTTPLKTEAEAKTHLASNIYKMFQGTYSGTYEGNSSSGTFTMIIDANGNVSGTAGPVGGNIATVTGSMLTKLSSGSKYVFAGTSSNNHDWTGTLDVATGILSGSYAFGSSKGTFTSSAPVTSGGFTTAMISGKSFSYSDTSNNTGAVTFNTDGTTSGLAGTWTINASGQLVIHVTSSGNIATFTLTGTTGTTFTANESVSNGNKAVVTFTDVSSSASFTLAMISGKTFSYTNIAENNIDVMLTFNSNGDVIYSGSKAGTWAISSSGQLVFTIISTGNIHTITLRSYTGSVISGSETITPYNTPNTMTLTAVNSGV